VLATHPLPDRYLEWNRRWSAPGGRVRRPEKILSNKMVSRLGHRWPRLRGPFGFQPNNQTRLFEFPWAYFELTGPAGRRALDVGGSNSGLQFVLSGEGTKVTNVDPGEEARGRGWRVSAESIARLNRAFKTDVTLISSTVQEADLPSEHFDVAYSISTIEHIPADEYPSLMSELRRVIKPGGRLVLTIDLFLNLTPFTTRTSNEWGTNADVAELVSLSGLRLVSGNTRELLGYPDFSTDDVLSRMESVTFGGYPAAAQCLVLQRD
jgi:SAM-dependent methyltransferase